MQQILTVLRWGFTMQFAFCGGGVPQVSLSVCKWGFPAFTFVDPPSVYHAGSGAYYGYARYATVSHL